MDQLQEIKKNIISRVEMSERYQVALNKEFRRFGRATVFGIFTFVIGICISNFSSNRDREKLIVLSEQINSLEQKLEILHQEVTSNTKIVSLEKGVERLGDGAITGIQTRNK